MPFELTELSLWMNVLIFSIAGVIVWLAGTKLAKLADAIAEKTSMSEALAGALLLGVATSLPEIATTVTASLLGNASLAMNNLFGGVAMQLAVLALVDFWLVRGALTFFSPQPVLLLGGTLLILQIAVGMTALSAGDIVVFGHIGIWPIILGGVYVLTLYFMNQFASKESWIPAEQPDTPAKLKQEAEEASGQSQSKSAFHLFALFFANCLIVLIGGIGVSASADALSQQTGLAGGFIGATLVALTTSLPEISTTAGAIRIGGYTMAISNIFGTNSLEVALLLPSDLSYLQGPVINAVDTSAIFMGGIGIILTALYLWGLLERRDKTVFRMGIDSAWVLAVYSASLVILYFIAE